MGLDLGVLTSASAQSLTQALDVYYERELGEPDPKALRLFADELEATYDDDNWPFTGDPIVSPSHIQLSIAWECWEQEVPRIVEAAHRHGFVVLDPQEETLSPPESFAVS
jgi:hypothetical protein